MIDGTAIGGPPAAPVVARGSPPAGPDEDRAELLDLLLKDGILHRSDDQPILSGDGRSARWMLDTLAVTLAPRGAELAARCLLGLLDGFEGRQLATYGLTGVPLLQGCVLHGGGRYRGALVRKERKPHGALKLIEGRLDPSEPVVVVDDSISSGYSMTECARRLEAAGFEVEGGVCLVRFDFDRGPVEMLEAGYRVAAVYDIWEDFIAHMDDEAPYPLNPTKDAAEVLPARERAAEGLHPAELARRTIAEYLNTGRTLEAPETLDRDYDAAGGCWVSLRRRADVHDRPARDGHWHFPGEPRGTATHDVVLAAVKTAAHLAADLPAPLRALDECAIAVTFFSGLEECTVGDLDNDRYGIVVRSAVRSPRMGGALPRMPGIADEWQQFRHAWRNNARLPPLEPYLLYRHDVEKVVEPGAPWQPTGVPLPRPEVVVQEAGCDPVSCTTTSGQDLAHGARRRVLDELGRDPGAEHRPVEAPQEVDAVFVTVYADGRIAGCAGGPPGVDAGDGDRDRDWLREYAVAAARDARFVDPRPDDEIAVSVSLLTNRLEIGRASPEWVVRPVRFADQALEVHQGDRQGILLPFVAVTHDLTPRGYVDEVIEKAGITHVPYRWTRYDCSTWLAHRRGVDRLVHGLPGGEPAADPAVQRERLHDLLLGYVRRHHTTAGPVFRRYDPFADRLGDRLGAPRLAYGAWVKARAGLRAEAMADVSRLEAALGDDGWVRLDGAEPTISELAFLLLALSELDGSRPLQGAVAERLWSQIDGHGRIAVRPVESADDAAHQDYGPGQALLALARAVGTGLSEPRPEVIARALRHYRMRFRQNHSWGAVAWLLQAFPAWGRVTDDPSHEAFAREVADWALRYQSSKTGAFLNDHQPDCPGATTALYVEGLAAVSTGGPRYLDACDRALAFVDQLVYQERDVPVLPNPDWAMGGLRRSVSSSAVYVDYVHHALAAVLTLQAGSAAVTTSAKPVALVSMPTLSTYVPSFQLALLTPTLQRAGFEVDPLSLFLHFGARIGPRLNDVLATVYPCMVGEWIWSRTAFGEFSDDDAYLRHYRSNFDELCEAAGCTVADIVRVRDEAAPAFVRWALDAVDWSAYGVVGFTVVFQQMVASLALAKAIKRRFPDLPIIFGGATFEDDIASEILLRNPEVDFVHCGDADLSFPELVSRLYAGESMAGLRGLMRREGGRVVYEGRAPNLEDLDLTPVPDFDEYFRTVERAGIPSQAEGEVMLPIETARGCWYGMKHHCTFCGLNRSGMEFRRKSPDQVLAMLRTLANRYGTRYFNAIDNILAPAYVSRLFGRLAEAHSDLRLHYEIRPNLTRAQLGQMRRGGLRSVQPGIESFSTHVLGLMRKNTTSVKNLELLKWTTYHGISNSYNILFGFPGETVDDYRRQADIIRLIPHLQPPYSMCQARPDRGSPMFEQPDEHSITMLRPSACYQYIYPPGYNLRRVSYFFEHEVADILPDDGYDECFKLVADWKRRWTEGRGRRPYLYYVKTWDSISIHDGRGDEPRGYRYDDARAAVYELCADANSRDHIVAALECDDEWLTGALQDFVDRGLMVFADDMYLSLALPENPWF